MGSLASAHSRESSSGPETDKKRRLAETDVDPSGDLTSNHSGETENHGTGNRADNQPQENRERPTRPGDRDTGDRDSENAPKPGQEE